jgi:serine/threonine-protein kinase
VSLSSTGRYAILGALATGGMAKVYLGRMTTAGGFSRLVAIKQLHRELAADPELVAMFFDEARWSAQIRHPNVVATLDVVSGPVAGDAAGPARPHVSLVLEYVEGAPLSELADAGARLPAPIALAIVVGVLRGLHGAHEATDDAGAPLGIVHRDVSPQNVIVGVDGAPRVIDFGVAKARSRGSSGGVVRGKVRYLAPEQLLGRPATRAADVYAAGVVLWELLADRRLIPEGEEQAMIARVLEARFEPPSAFAPDQAIPPGLDAIVLRALAQDPGARFATAAEMADALEGLAAPVAARPTEVGKLVAERAKERLDRQRALVRATFAPEEYRPLEEIVADLAVAPPPPAASALARGRRPRRWTPAVVLLLGAAISLVLWYAFAFAPRERPRGPAAPLSARAAASEAPVVDAPAASEAPPPIASETPSQAPAPLAPARSAVPPRRPPPVPRDPRTRR